jgi:hypothetical protein
MVVAAAACGLGAVALGGLNGLSLATSESRVEGIVAVPTVFRAAYVRHVSGRPRPRPSPRSRPRPARPPGHRRNRIAGT